MRALVCVLGLVAVGCGGQAEPTRPPLRVEEGQKAVDLYASNAGQGASSWHDPAALPGQQDGGPVFRGLTLEQWADQVRTPDPADHQQAILALAQLGQPGYAKLLDIAQHHRAAETRVLALQAIDIPQLVQDDKNTVPMLIRMLRDPSPLVRQAAALRLAWFDRVEGGSKLTVGYQADQRVQALQIALQDPSPYVREAALDSLRAIQDAQKGTVASD